MKRLLPTLAGAVVAASLMLGSWQGYRYQRLLDQIDDLKVAQLQWLEESKRSIASIAVFRSPARLRALADSELQLDRSPPTIYLDLHSAAQAPIGAESLREAAR